MNLFIFIFSIVSWNNLVNFGGKFCKISLHFTLEHLQRCSVFFTSKFSYVLFCNPTNQTETIIYDRPIRNTEQQSDHIYYTLFWRCTALLRVVRATVTCAMMLSQNHFPESNGYKLDFLHSFVVCRMTTYWAPLEMLLGINTEPLGPLSMRISQSEKDNRLNNYCQRSLGRNLPQVVPPQCLSSKVFCLIQGSNQSVDSFVDRFE